MKEKIVLGLSGGVDSAVAARLLQERYEVTGLYLDIGLGGTGAADAAAVAERLGIPFETADIRAELEREFRRSNIPLTSELMDYMIESVGKRHNCSTEDDFYAAIGYGGIQLWKVLPRIKEEALRLQKSAAPDQPQELPPPTTPEPKRRVASGVLVEGMDNCLIKFSRCCNPLPGDEIIGFITRGYGVSVHRADCPNAAPEKRKPEEADRWVKVSWVESSLPNYKTALELSSKDRDGLTLDVAMALSTAKVKVSALSARSMPDGYASVSVVLEVKDREELSSVINKLNNIQGVYQVVRASGK